MKKGIWIKLTAILMAIVVAMLSGCSLVEDSDESLPEDTLEKLEDAINANDMQGVLDCLDEDAVDTLTAGLDIVLGIAGTAFDVDLKKLGITGSNLIDMAPLFTAIGMEYGTTANGAQVDYQATKTLIKGSKAMVYFTEVNSGDEGAVIMKKDDDEWFITLSMTPISEEDADRIIIPGQEEEEDDDEESLAAILALLSGKDEETVSEDDEEESVTLGDLISVFVDTDALEDVLDAVEDIVDEIF